MKPSVPAGYAALLVEVKQRIRTAQLQALRQVNRELVSLYDEIGHLIVARQAGETWGRAVVETLARDLQAEFPGASGFSAANLWRMKLFHETYGPDEKLAPLVREIGWSHNVVILEKCKNANEREFYLRSVRRFGWTRNVLLHQIENRTYEKTLSQQTNFAETLPPDQQAQAHSNRAPQGRKRDFADAERLLRRHVANELVLSFVPNPEHRLWRTLTRTKYQLTRDRVRLQNQIESLLEEARIKLSGCVSDLLGSSSRRMLKALAEGETDSAQLAAMAHPSLRASRQQLQDALHAAATVSALHRQILGLFLTRLELIEQQMEILDKSIAEQLRQYHDAVSRLAQVPGYGVDSAQQVIAEVGPSAATFPSPEQLSSWVGACPGRDESAEVSKNNRSPKGNKMVRRVLSQVANAAERAEGSLFQSTYRRLVVRLGHNKAIWAIVHRLCRLTWKILHQGVQYIEFGSHPNVKAVKKRADKLIRQLRSLGYQVQVTPVQDPAAP